MADIRPLEPESLRRHCAPTSLGFETTAGIRPAELLIGQSRALDALSFGTAIRRRGYNLFVIGGPGFGRHRAVRQFLEERAATEERPDEWVYVNNFRTSRNPRALRLPPGTAMRFKKAMGDLIDDLKTVIPSLFETEDYRNRLRAITEESGKQNEEAFENLNEKAEKQGIAILRTPMGFALAPVRDGNVIKPEAFNALDKSERERIEGVIEELQKELEKVLRTIPAIEKARRDRIRELNAELASSAVGTAVAGISAQFQGIEPVLDYLGEVESDLVENVALFLREGAAEMPAPEGIQATAGPDLGEPQYRRYGVNVVVADDDSGGAPVVSEEHPTLGNLVGRIEHLSQMGTLVTDFLLIKPGALHRANGGYIVLDARKIIGEPFAWEALKRTLRGDAIRIESAAEQFGFVTTVTLDPEPIPLDVKVVLIGERFLYDLLVHLDPDFADLFKVEADFEDRWERTGDNEQNTARLFASIIANEGLRPLDASGAALMIEESARLAEDAERLSLQVGQLADRLREADFWAGEAGRDAIGAEDVERATRERIRRKDRLRERVYEMIERETVLIDTDGEAVGQVNGLSVTGLGGFMFGRPSRITARVRMGSGKLIDIEREVELGGPLHSKGVMILASYLQANFALDEPVSLWASLVFEQSYGGVDGDSASSAELYALLSALSDAPIRQSLAVTGSVNQLGHVQAIGGVNEKIEGFFDICKSRGLTGSQGVLIPAANVKHLMLRADVVEAASDGKFHVYPVGTIDEGIALLTGRPAGERGPDGGFPPDTINGMVDARLRLYAEKRRAFGIREGGGSADGNA
ncbi:MAG TPA: ATP-binding protein [Afifellaceae bacterium]|nr:ATP-binding protein [Afifellaceae bacterium]